MSSSSLIKYDFFSAGIIFTAEVFIQSKKIWGTGSSGLGRGILINVEVLQ